MVYVHVLKLRGIKIFMPFTRLLASMEVSQMQWCMYVYLVCHFVKGRKMVCDVSLLPCLSACITAGLSACITAGLSACITTGLSTVYMQYRG